MVLRLICLIAVCLAAAPLKAGEDTYITSTKIEPVAFQDLTRVLAEEMSPGGRFEYVSPAERSAVERELALIGARLAGHASIQDLDERARIDVFNAQERANAILTKRDGERLICERRSRIGSNRRETVCETYAERQARSEGSRRRARDLNRRVQQCDQNGRCVSG